MSAAKRERLPQLDIYRALAILGVLHVHSSSFAAGEQALHSPYFYWINWINIFFKFGTPSFIFLSSFVLFYNYYARPVSGQLIWSFYRRRLAFILLPYLVASVGYYVLTLAVNGELTGRPLDSLLGFAAALFSGSAYAHLYFVFISIQFYALFPLLLKLLQRYKGLVTWAVPLGLALQWGFIIWNKYGLHIVEKGSLAISYLAYYMMGAYIAVHFDRVKGWLTAAWKECTQSQQSLTALLWCGWLLAAFVHVQLWYEGRHHGRWTDSLWYELLWNTHTMLSALVLLRMTFILFRKGPGWLVALLTRLGELSFAVYLIHPLLLAVYRRLTEGIFSVNSAAYVMMIHVALAVALGGSWLTVQFAFRRIGASWIALGSIPRSLVPARPGRSISAKADGGKEREKQSGTAGMNGGA